MSSLQEQLFIQVASRSLNRLTKDLQEKFEPKKGDRFNVKGITYEIGPPRFVDKGIRFEVSSKIPGEELPSGYGESEYFKEIETRCKSSEKKPHAADMENIVRETRDQERKERDYVKLAYQYSQKELYSDSEILREVESYARNPGKKEVPPPVPGATTLAARLILSHVAATVYGVARKNVETLIRANDAVRAELKKLKKKN